MNNSTLYSYSVTVYTLLDLTVCISNSALNCKISAEETGEEQPVQISGVRRSGGPAGGPDYAAYVFVFPDGIIYAFQ